MLAQVDSRTVALSLVLVAPVMIIAGVTLASTAILLASPCETWGVGSGSVTVTPLSSCSSAGATTETVAQALISLVLVQGGILGGGVLGIVGVLLARKNIVILSSTILFAESVPLVFGGLFVLSALPAAFFLWSSGKLPRT